MTIYRDGVAHTITTKADDAPARRARTIDGVAYTIDGDRDRHGDMFAEGAFDAAIEAFNASQLSVKMRDHHGETVGIWTALEVVEGELRVKGELLPTDAGDDLATLIEGLAVDKLSIGVDETRSTWELLSDPPGRLWTAAWIVEISPVTFPAKDSTSITSIKGEATRLGAPQHGRSFALMLSRAIASKSIEDGEGQAAIIERISTATGLDIIDVYALMIEDHPVKPSTKTIKALGEQLAPTSEQFMTAALADGFIYMDEASEPTTEQTTATTSPQTTVSISIETKGEPQMTEKIDVVETENEPVIDPRDARIEALEKQIFIKSFSDAVAARRVTPAQKPKFEKLLDAAGLDMTLDILDSSEPREDIASETVGSSSAGIVTKSAEVVDDGLYAARVAVKNGYISKATFDKYVASR